MSLLEEMFDDKNEQLNERPYSRTQSAIDSAKGKVKGLFGSGQVEQGAKDSGLQANQLWADFKRYIGRKYGSHPDAVSYNDVAAFFKGNNLDISFLGDNQRRSFSTKDVGTALLKAAQKLNTDYDNEEEAAPDQGNAGNPPPQPQGGQGGQGHGNPPQPQGGGLPDRLTSLSAADRAKLLRLLS